ncbi:MAG TPA: hypothetical protein VIM15_02585 [Gemmatimonadaceae bacterium]|jgi:hypothetical protein
MTKTPTLVYALSLSLVSIATLPAQSPGEGGGPPKVVQIIREEVKPGKGAAHAKVEAGWPRAFAKAKWPTHYLAMTSMSGPSEAWFLIGYPSMAAWEQDNQNSEKATALTAQLDQLSARDGELLSNTRGVVATYIDSLSYKPHVDMPTMRYFQVLTFRVRPGHESDFMQAAKMFRTAYEKAKDLPAAWATYRVDFGMPGPVYLVFIPAKSLEEMDQHPAQDKAFGEAMGAENWKALNKIAADSYVNVESNLFALSPKMSYPPTEFAARDPDFWTPKALAVAKMSSMTPRDTTKRDK